MKKICIIGHFGFGKNLLNGQTIKTKIITTEIEKQFGKESIWLLDLAGGIKRIPILVFQVIRCLYKCDDCIILPVENGLRFLTPLLTFCNFFFKRKLHYVVIGGWLPNFLSKNNRILIGLKKFSRIYVETNTMKDALEAKGLGNLIVLPNCKSLNILSEKQLIYPQNPPYRLCTFSRVMKEKGIETAVDIINKVNNSLGYIAYSLDIYGPIWEDSKEWFERLREKFSNNIRYCGSVAAEKSVEILPKYFALLFPTHFYTEGIPGTIIDAYAAGIPVISAKWESFSDVVDEGVTGMGYDFDNLNDFENILLKVAESPNSLLDMKVNCLHKASDYLPEVALAPMIRCISDTK